MNLTDLVTGESEEDITVVVVKKANGKLQIKFSENAINPEECLKILFAATSVMGEHVRSLKKRK